MNTRQGSSLALITIISMSLAGCDFGGSKGANSATSTPVSTTSSAPAVNGGSSTTSTTSSTASSTSSTNSSSSSSATLPSQSDALASLKAKSGASAPAAVKVGNHYEGASLAANNIVNFWKTDSAGKWQSDGSKPRAISFPPDAPASITGALLPGATHALFTVHTNMSGTGTGIRTINFIRTDADWARVVGDGSGSNDDLTTKVVTEQDSTDGAMIDSEVKDGKLWVVSQDFSHNQSIADAPLYRQAYTVQGWTFHLSGGHVSASGEPDAGSTPSGGSYQAGDRAVFTSPTGLNTCFIVDGSVGCPLSEKVSDEVHAYYVSLSDDGVSTYTGDGDPLDFTHGDGWASGANLPTKNGMAVLPYGSSITDGTYTCKSSENGFDCSSDDAGFSLNASKLVMWGKRSG